MSLRNLFFKTRLSYKIYLYYNLYIRHKCFLKRSKYSQWGEDLVIIEFFKNKKNGIYFDIGCFHPVMYSNTCLLYKKGWRGINIDINPVSLDLFKILRPADFNFCTTLDENKKDFKIFYDHSFSPANTLDETYYKKIRNKSIKDISIKMVKSKTVDEILNLAKVTNVDFLNIDVEGMDFRMLIQLIPNKIKPKLISIETHNVDGSKSQDCDKINDFLNNSSYRILKRVGPSTLFHK